MEVSNPESKNGVCCLCLSAANTPLTDLSMKNLDGLTHFEKISVCLSHLANVINENTDCSFKLCGKCCDLIEMIYQFNITSMKNIGIYLLKNFERTVKPKPGEGFDQFSKLDQENKNFFIKTDILSNPLNADLMERSTLSEQVEDVSIFCQVNMEVDSGKHRNCQGAGSKDVLNDLLPELSNNLAVNEGLKINRNQHCSNRNPKNDSVAEDYRCEVCGKAFRHKSRLNTHFLMHTDVWLFKCDFCQKPFRHRGNLKQHIISLHTDIKPYKCKICDSAFSRPGDLKTHELVHNDDKPHMCEECGMRFKYKNTLVNHKLTHSAEKSYECELCKKVFTQPSTLYAHKRSHSGVKPFTCDICGKSFVAKGPLDIHKRSHTGHKPYSCDQCDRQFSCSQSLVRHKRIHSGERPYKCDICARAFRQTSALNTHKRIHTR